MNALINLTGKFNFPGISNISQKISDRWFQKRVALPVFDVFLFEKIEPGWWIPKPVLFVKTGNQTSFIKLQRRSEKN